MEDAKKPVVRKMPTKAERLAAKQAKLEDLAAKQAALVEKQKTLQRELSILQRPSKKDREAARKAANHRSILIGKMVEKRIQLGLLSEADFKGWMDAFLTKPEDREIFSLAVQGDAK